MFSCPENQIFYCTIHDKLKIQNSEGNTSSLIKTTLTAFKSGKMRTRAMDTTEEVKRAWDTKPVVLQW